VIAFTHDGEETDGYMLYVRVNASRELKFDLGRLVPVNGSVQGPLPPLAAGTYILTVAAYRGTREGPRSMPLSVRLTSEGQLLPGPVRKGMGRGDLSGPVVQAHDSGRRSTPPGRFVKWLWRVIAGDDSSPATKVGIGMTFV
jgi:hypothetical protein